MILISFSKCHVKYDVMLSPENKMDFEILLLWSENGNEQVIRACASAKGNCNIILPHSHSLIHFLSFSLVIMCVSEFLTSLTCF